MHNATQDLPTLVELLQLRSQPAPDQATYFTNPAVVRFRGRLDVPVLKATLADISLRHAFLGVKPGLPMGGQPSLEPTAWLSPRVLFIDLQAMPKAKQIQEVDRRIQAEAPNIVSSNKEPLIRISLLRLSLSEHILLFCIHFINAYGWSEANFVEEVSTLYSTNIESHSSSVSVPSVQYSDYIKWRQEWA